MQESYMLRIGRLIQAKRTERGLTEKQLADGICTVAILRDIEAGRTFATLDLLQRITERLHLPLQHLLSLSGHAAPANNTPQPPTEDRIAATYKKLLTTIERIEAASEVPDDQWVTFMMNKVDTLLGLGMHEEAIELLHTIEQRVEDAEKADPSMVAVIYQKLGQAYFQIPNPLESYTNYMRAYMISAHLNEYSPLTSRITMDLARVGDLLGGTKQLADQLFELGVKSQENGELTRACTYLEQANAMYKANNLVAMGQEMKQAYQALLRKQHQPEQAIQELNFTIKRLEKAGDLKQLANTYAQKADLHLNLAQTEAAKQDLLQAHAICTDELAATDPRLTLVYHVWARYCLLVQEPEEAVTYGEMATRFYEKMGFYQQAAESMRYVAAAFRDLDMEESALETEAAADELRNRKLPPLP